MKMRNKTGPLLAVVAGLLFTAAANAAVVDYPMLDIKQVQNLDTGVSSATSGLTIDGTAFAIIPNSSLGSVYTIPYENFYLTSDASGSGTLKVGNNGSILAANFSNLALSDLGTVDPSFSGVGGFTADLTYTGGSMATANMTGRIEGGFNNATGAIALGSNFTAGGLIAKIGKVQVVPVPAAVWLFGSALLGLAGMAKRKKVA